MSFVSVVTYDIHCASVMRHCLLCSQALAYHLSASQVLNAGCSLQMHLQAGKVLDTALRPSAPLSSPGPSCPAPCNICTAWLRSCAEQLLALIKGPWVHAGTSAADRDAGTVPSSAGGDLPGPPDGGYPLPPPPAGGRGSGKETREERAERQRRDEIREDRCVPPPLPLQRLLMR